MFFKTFWFWIILIGFGIITYLVNDDDEEYSFGVGATITFVITVFLLVLGNNLYFHKILQTISNNLLNSIGIIIGYFIAGAVWSFIKWYFFLLNRRDKYLKENKSNIQAPKVAEYKYLILKWMTYWPFSLVWTITHDPIRRIFRWIYEKISTTLQSMSDKIFEPVIKEQKQTKEQEATDKFKLRTGISK